MKSLECVEGAWRDKPLKQCMYGALLGVVMMASIQIGLVQPKEERLHVLSNEMMQLEKLNMQAQEEERVEAHIESENACAWEKNEAGWRMAGEFKSVYACLLHEKDARAVASMRLQKHMMGVSVVLGFDEMPA